MKHQSRKKKILPLGDFIEDKKSFPQDAVMGVTLSEQTRGVLSTLYSKEKVLQYAFGIGEKNLTTPPKEVEQDFHLKESDRLVKALRKLRHQVGRNCRRYLYSNN